MPLKLRDGISTAEVDYGTALLDERRGQYWNLNPTGALVLRVLLEGGTADQAARALVEEYAVDLDSACLDVEELVENLRSAGLIEQ
ncbi:MAG TPA: lasso peptide biosynthesis PqqD family chaperone [Egibacteraceae bacterium]|jgi:hypothetical protein|nr:lasso peptide biosynthesis PqqD family chaperone [Egibacteraceae bacterium]